MFCAYFDFFVPNYAPTSNEVGAHVDKKIYGGATLKMNMVLGVLNKQEQILGARKKIVEKKTQISFFLELTLNVSVDNQLFKSELTFKKIDEL